MLNLLEKISPLDLKRINNYIRTYGVRQGYVGNNKFLSIWAEQKKKLYKLLGGNLIYKVPCSYNKEEKIIEDELFKLYKNNEFPDFWDSACKYRKNKANDECNFELIDLYAKLYKLMSFKNFLDNNCKEDIKYKDKEKNKTFQIKKGQKFTRALIKAIDFFFPKNTTLKKMCDDFINARSLVLNTKVLTGNLCFSIHPLDFFTMSDNNDWSTCLSWKKGGCYRGGTVELLNSNNVICVYLESKNLFYFNETKEKNPDYAWNNKKFRQIFICDKNIIVNGKSYPFIEDEITIQALKILRELALKNWNRSYQYGIERYNDMLRISKQEHIDNNKYWIESGNTKKHNIIFDTNVMYNDMFNDKGTHYYCVRNYVKKNKVISISGKQPCLCCMNKVPKIDTEWEFNDYDYNEKYINSEQLLCPECISERSCSFCKNSKGLYSTVKIGSKRICSKCWNNHVVLCPDCGKQIILNNMWGRVCDENIVYMRLVDKDKIDYDNLFDQFEPYICCDKCKTKLDTEEIEFEPFKPDSELAKYRGPLVEKIIVLKNKYSKNDEDYIKHTDIKIASKPLTLKLDTL